jgi:hypothetical protein
VAHATHGSDALSLHEALEVKGARILQAPHGMQAEAADAQMVPWQKSQAVRLDAQAHEAARWLPALLLLCIALYTEIQALATPLGFDRSIEYPFDSQQAGWCCCQEMCNMVERYGTLLP